MFHGFEVVQEGVWEGLEGRKEGRNVAITKIKKYLSKSKVTVKSVLVRTWTGKITVNLEEKKKQK